MKYFLLLSCLFFQLTTSAQIDKDPLPVEENEFIKMEKGNSVYGKVLDLQTNRPVEAASIHLWAILTDSISMNSKDSLIATGMTKANGEFKFDNLPSLRNLSLRITAIGYEEGEAEVDLSGNPIEGNKYVHKDVGNMILARASEKLEGIVITASTPAMRMGIDKKVFSVDNMLTAQGGTAVDIMKNIPSVSVDVDGNIELRNSAPTIFVDGRPTLLTLDQIPSDNIDRIEMITNPSAKFDASSGAGIINIILKKNKRNGLNGLVSLSGGIPESYGGNANINLRQGKINFFAGGGYRHSLNNSKGNSYRQNKVNGIADSYFNQESKNNRERDFNNIRFGFDYFIDNRNTLTLSQGFNKGDFTNSEAQTQNYFSVKDELEKYGERRSNGDFEFRRNNSHLNFTHKFPKEGRELTADVNMNRGKVKDRSGINNSFFLPDHSSAADPNIVRNEGANNNRQVTAKVDFEDPLGEKSKIETGVRSYFNNYESQFNSFSVKGNSETKLPLSNHYKYAEQVHAAYFTYTGMMGSIGYQAGLRAEYSKFEGTLIDSAQKFGYEFPSGIDQIWNSLFPSLYLSKQLSEKEEIQLNYSRRVRRPNFWQLNPFIDINDPLNIQQGNPGLKPEFRNSYEFNYSKKFADNSNFLGVIYYRNTQGDITRYSDTLTEKQYEQLNNAAVDPNAILNTFINSQSNNSLGVELTLQKKIGKSFDITPSGSFAYRKVNSGNENERLSNEGWNWNARLNANYKIKSESAPAIINKTSFQFSAQYESPRVLPQGKRLRRYGADLAIKKDLFKNDRGSMTFSVNDIFNTQRWGTIYDTENFYQETYRYGRGTSFRLSFTYKFGNSDFTLFKRHQVEDI